MEDTSEGSKADDSEAKKEESPPREKFNFVRWLKGKSRSEFLENLSYVIIFTSTAMIMIGIGLGSFMKYVVFVGAAGALLLLPGIIIYIASQLIAPEQKSEGTGKAV